MKHAWIMSLVLLLWPVESLALQRGVVKIEDPSGREIPLYQDSYALVVGVSKYRNGWPSLPGVPDDVRQVQAALSALFDTYNDTSGAFTNGRAAIGDIRLDVARLIDGLD